MNKFDGRTPRRDIRAARRRVVHPPASAQAPHGTGPNQEQHRSAYPAGTNAHPPAAAAPPHQVIPVSEPAIISQRTAESVQESRSSYLRLTVTNDDRKGDVVIPGNVTVAELLPSIVRRFITLTPKDVTGGFTLNLVDGTELAGGKTLFEQGVKDGQVLCLDRRTKAHAKKYDDIIEAVADATEEHNKPWTHAHTSAMAVAASTTLVLASLYLLIKLTPEMGMTIPIMTGGLTVLLAGLAWVLTRSERTWHGLITVMTEVAAAGVTGYSAAHVLDQGELAPIIGGISVTLAAAISFPLVRGWRELLSIPIIVGMTCSMLVGADIAFENTAERVPIILAGLFAIAILVVPRLALRASGLDHEKPVPDPRQTAKLYSRGHRLMVSFWGASALSIILLTPGTVALGNWGIAVIAISALLLSLSARRSYGRIDVLVCYLGALAIGLTLAVSIMAMFPGYWAAVIITLLVTVTLIVAFGLILDRSFTWTRRLADIGEMVATIAIIPAVILPLELW